MTIHSEQRGVRKQTKQWIKQTKSKRRKAKGVERLGELDHDSGTLWVLWFFLAETYSKLAFEPRRASGK